MASSLLRFMKDAGNLPASGSYDQLIELKTELDSLKTRERSNGLQMLLAASTSVSGQPGPPNNHPHVLTPSSTFADVMAFGVGDGVGAVLDNPLLQDFLQQPYSNWPAEPFDPVSGLPAGQFQFDWENANLFGNF